MPVPIHIGVADDTSRVAHPLVQKPAEPDVPKLLETIEQTKQNFYTNARALTHAVEHMQKAYWQIEHGDPKGAQESLVGWLGELNLGRDPFG